MPNFTTITETPEQKATTEQLAQIGQHYRFDRDWSKGTRTLEIACGTGIGLNYLAKTEETGHILKKLKDKIIVTFIETFAEYHNPSILVECATLIQNV